MRLFKSLLVLICMCLGLTAKTQMSYVPGDMLIQFKSNVHPLKVLDNYANFKGETTFIRLGELLSAHMNVYQVHFNPEFSQDRALLDAIRRDEGVSLAQFNHYVEPREGIVPDDPLFDQQWHHLNTGQTGGTPGADIGSTKAWEITTGGLTATGDTIVVCVIEGGNLNHDDLRPNAWRNHAEIPGNGIDDDENGFVDDHLGWNVLTLSDSPLLLSPHGTQVMGMIGAKGNNGLGVTGINWDIKIMAVAGHNTNDEARVLAAYNYPLVMRKLYNESGGERGAFVVATNSSWGINNGNMAEVPLWDAFYDTLGVYGVLNCGATSNNSNANVDIVGDVPTNSASPYMIGVTSSNHHDIRQGAYGINSVDVAAPGQSVLTTTSSSGYNTPSGTSYASPLTTGLIALMYSVPCESFIDLVKSNPQLGADYVRSALLQGVDPVESMEGFVGTGGRINAYNSLKILMDNCSEDLCLPPFSFHYDLQNDTLYTFTWTALSEQGVSLRFKEEGADEWTTVSGITEPNFSFVPPSLCTNYIFEIGADCNLNPEGEIQFVKTLVFESKGCCIAPILVTGLVVDEATVQVTWEGTFNLALYEVYYKESDTDQWVWAGNSEDFGLILQNLQACTFYDLSVVPSCDSNPEHGKFTQVRTFGCGNCIDLFYCDSRGTNTTFEYINKATFGEWSFTTGNNGGYLLMENANASFLPGSTYPFEIIPGFTAYPIHQTYKLWIDLNQDGEFGADELLSQTAQSTPSAFTGTLSIPENAVPGSTRLRISMKRANNPGTTLDVCEEFLRGETEDYCIELIDTTLSVSAVQGINHSIYPNPSRGEFFYQLNHKTIGRVSFELYDITGKMVAYEQLQNQGHLQFPHLSDGLYIYVISVQEESALARSSGKLVISR